MKPSVIIEIMSAAKKDHPQKKHHEQDTPLSTVHDVKLLAPPKSLVPAPKPVQKKKHRLAGINTPMETHHFIFSQLGILISALAFLGGMYWVLNSDNFATRFVDEYLPVTIKQASFGLEINSPDDELLTFSDSVVISGTTSPKSSVIIAVTGTTDHFDALEADNDGRFQRTITLTPGLNTIEISSFDAAENSKTVTRTVYYSEEKLQ